MSYASGKSVKVNKSNNRLEGYLGYFLKECD